MDKVMNILMWIGVSTYVLYGILVVTVLVATIAEKLGVM